ncbi:MAG TPA: hypothetical protein VMZ32_03255, partial [Gammaproteobacteria bacterium]|nr:hypothetical protein [Gammaproteobacteria bacterium]
MPRLAVWLGLFLCCGNTYAEFSGNVAVEAISFSETAQFEGQFDENLTLSFTPRWDGDWNDGADLWSVEL